MTSAPRGGGGEWKSGQSKGGCMNFIVQISCPARTRGEGVKKSGNFADVINGWPLARDACLIFSFLSMRWRGCKKF